MRFLVDAQLPPGLVAWLGEHGCSASAVRDLGLREADDGSIWEFVVTGGWTIITKDEDFVARCVDNPASAAQVVWLRLGNCTNQVLFRRLDPLWERVMDRLNAGERIVEIR